MKDTLVCFDMDNTLVKSNKCHLEAWTIVLKKYKLPKKKRKEVIEFFGLKNETLLTKLYPHLTKKKVKEIVDVHDDLVVKNAKKHITRIPWALQTIKHAKREYKLALLSNCKRREIKAILKAAKIKEDFFDIIVGNDNVKRAKPHPDEILKAMKELKIKKGFMVGDSIYDIQAGKKARLKTIAVCTGNHSRKELQKQKPWKVVDSIKEVKRLL